MSEETGGMARAYKRAGIGSAIAALAWTLTLVVSGREPDDRMINWLIPIAAAALSVLCFSLSARAKEE
jgi:hypothetical protein